MELSSELNNLLADEEEPLYKRIRLAKNVFITNSLSSNIKDHAIESKEEKALKWLCTFPESKDARAALQRCLCSDRTKNYKYLYISPATRTSVILKLCEILTREELLHEEKNLFLQSSICLLDVHIFKQHFNHIISDYTALIGAIIKCISSEKTGSTQDVFVKVIDNLRSYSQKFYSSDEFRRCFHRHVLCPLSQLLENDESNSLKDLSTSIYKCISMTLFPKRRLDSEFKMMHQILEQPLHEQSMETEDCGFFQQLCSASATLTSKEFIALIRVIFKSFIRSCRKDNHKHCQLFLILCYVLGLHPCVKNGSPNFSNEKQNLMPTVITVFSKKKLIHSLKTAIDILNLENVDITVEIAGFPFLKWLQSLCDTIVSTEESIEGSAIELLTSLSDLDPNILDSHKVTAIGHVMFNRSEKTKKETKRARSSYFMFLKSLLRSSLKLHRIQKLASRLLSSAKDQLTINSNGSKLTAEEVLPKEFCSEFGASMQSLVATQAMAMLKTLTFHLLEDCVEPMEQGKREPAVVIMLQLTTCLINEFLLGYRAIDPNIPQSKMEKFVSLMGDLGNVIGRLGKVLLLGKHNPVTMGAFLDLSLCWGELQLLLIFYQPDNPSALTEFPQLPSTNRLASRGSSTATDFSVLHPHLSDGEWSHLVERIVNFGDDHCKKRLNELVVQKLRTLLLFEPEVKSDKAVSCALYLISKASDTPSSLSLISNNIDVVAQLLDLGEVAKLAELIVGEHASESGDLLVALRRNATILPILTLTVLKEIGIKAFKNYYDIFKPRKRKHSEVDKRTSILETPSTKGTQLSFSLFSAVDEALSSVLKEHGGIREPQNLLRTSSNAATLLPTKLALSLHEYFDGQLVGEGSEAAEPLTVDVSTLRHLLGFLRLLPLSRLSDISRAVIIMCLISLLIALREHEDSGASSDAEANVIEVILLTVSSGVVFKELVNHVEVGKFLAWYVCSAYSPSLDSSHDVARKLKCLQEQLMEKFIEIGMSSAVGFEQLKKVIRALKEELKKGSDQLDLICTISPLLMASLAGKCAKPSIRPVNKKIYLKYYKLLTFNLIKAVKFDLINMDRQKLECFTLILLNFISIKSQKRISMCAEHFEGLILMVRKRFSSRERENEEDGTPVSIKEASTHLKTFNSCCFHFLENLASHRVPLKGLLSPTFVFDIWEMLISHHNCSLADRGPFIRTVKALLMSCNKKEFMLLAKDLVAKLEEVDPVNPDPLTLNHYMLFWKILVKCSLNKGLAECRQQAIKDALPLFLAMVHNWESFPENRQLITAAVSILEFEDVLLKKGKVILNHQILDLVFVSLSIIPLSDVFRHIPSSLVFQNHEEISQDLVDFHKLFSACSDSLLALVNQHPDHLVDRIPSFLQCLTKLFKICVAHGNVEYSSAGGLQGGKLSEHLIVMTDCASNVEWISNALVKLKKDFVRVSPYFIADAVQSFESRPIHPAIKSHLHNCIHGFIYMCDNNGLALLHHTLPPGPKEIFKALFENYKKYYKFKGKI